jgi:hypothetical protein
MSFRPSGSSNRGKKARPFSKSIRYPIGLEQLEDRTVMTVSPIGAETLLNSITSASQEFVSVAVANDGSYVATWQSNHSGNYDIYARRFDSSGNGLGSEFLVNTYTTSDQELARVAVNRNTGDFTIVWQSNGQDGDGEGIYGQRFNAAGVKQGSEFRVSTYTQYNQDLASIAMDDNGNFVVAWQSGSQDSNANTQDGGFYGVYFQRYNAAGVKQGGETIAHSADQYFQGAPSVAMDGAGNFVIAYTDIGFNLSAPGFVKSDVMMRLFNSSGTALGSVTKVNTTGANSGAQGAIVAARDHNTGNIIFAWSSTQNDTGGETNDVYARQYNIATNSFVSSEFLVNSYTLAEQKLPSVAIDNSSNFVVSWISGSELSNPPLNYQQDGSEYGVYARRYTWAGASEPEFRVNTTTANDQVIPNVAMNFSNGNFIVAWSSNLQDGDQFGNYSQRYAGTNANPIANTGGPYAITEGQSLVLNGGSSSDPEGQQLTYTWDVNGDSVFGDATGVNPTLTWSQLQALGITDGPTTRNVSVRVSDPFGGVTTSAASLLTVTNAAPVLTPSVPAVTINEGSTATFSVTITDPSAVDTFSVQVNWQDGSNADTLALGLTNSSGTVGGTSYTWTASSRTLQLSHLFTDNGSFAVSVAATDKDGGVGSTNKTVTVNNVVPTFTITGASGTVGRGAEIVYLLTTSDPSSVDQSGSFTFNFDWNGDGIFDQSLVGPNGAKISHPIDTLGPVTIRATATDKDGGVSALSTISLNVVPYQVIGTVLYWYGTSGNDAVTLNQVDPSTVSFTETLLNGVVTSNTLQFTGITSVSAEAQGGADSINASLIGTTTSLYGGSGVDSIIGSNQADLIWGGLGSDDIQGGIGNDTIYGDHPAGGTRVLTRSLLGSDTISGGDGDDTINGDGDGGEGVGDTIYGGSGNDTINADGSEGSNNFGKDYIDGGDDNDVINSDGAEGAADTVIAGAGDDFVNAGPGNDSVDGGIGNDILLGGVGTTGNNDTLLGGDGKDILVGDGGIANPPAVATGSDSLDGGTGEDLIIAGWVITTSNPSFSWYAVRNEWVSANSFADRRDHILGVSAGLNGSSILTLGTITYDDKTSGGAAVIDSVFGGTEDDWLLVDVAEDSLTGTEPGDFITDLSPFPRPTS